VIHGMVDEFGNYGGNPSVDIVMPDINIDLQGIPLFEDASLTLVYGRRYGVCLHRAWLPCLIAYFMQLLSLLAS
jgi:hypothetical protein